MHERLARRMTARALSLWEKAGASAGALAALSLGIGYAISRTGAAALARGDVEYARALLAERMKWEWVTFVRLLGGILVVWFTSSLADRLRTVERPPGRVAEAAFGLGILWAGVWLFSAFFNSVSIMLAADYNDAGGARIAGVLAREIPYVLTGSVVFTWLLATSFVVLRSGGFPKVYAFGTVALTVALLVVALIDWYGTGSLSPFIVALALLWTATTSAVLVVPPTPRMTVADRNSRTTADRRLP
jgi:hypothetical protein